MQISDIDNTVLDRWVAKAEGIDVRYSNVGEFWRVLGEIDEIQWLPHRDWSQAGPIIERERIAIFPYGDNQWSATIGNAAAREPERGNSESAIIGATPLIAAMRCYVLHRFSADELKNG